MVVLALHPSSLKTGGVYGLHLLFSTRFSRSRFAQSLSNCLLALTLRVEQSLSLPSDNAESSCRCQCHSEV